MSAAQELNRGNYAAPAAPVRIVHIGLGAFHRAHQAWYTQVADPRKEWGIASFTGRSPRAAEILAAQDGLYTLVERAEAGDTFTVMESIVAAHDGADLAALSGLVAAPSTAVITLTITEAAYYLAADGTLDTAAPVVAADLAALRAWADSGSDALPETAPQSMAGRLAVALDARRRSGAGPVAVVSCDNLSANGTAACNAVAGTAAQVDAGLAEWIDANVSFVDTSIDRITPRTTAEDIALVEAETGYADRSPVVTEPFRSWVLSGAFPAGRPRWEDAGAVFVDDIEAFERRKLWLLNGAHSLLAYAGQLRGHATVAEGLADAVCDAWVEQFWDEASRHLREPGLDVPEYREALRARFSNSRIAHQLAQIAIDGSSKLRMRAVPVLKAERADGRSGEGAARLIGAWLAYLEGRTEVQDAESGRIGAALKLSGRDRTTALVGLLDEELAASDEVLELVEGLAASVVD